MSATSTAGASAARAANSKPLEILARAGFIGYGIVHLLFAWLALQIAFGRPADDGDQSGALRTLAAQPLGHEPAHHPVVFQADHADGGSRDPADAGEHPCVAVCRRVRRLRSGG